MPVRGGALREPRGGGAGGRAVRGRGASPRRAARRRRRNHARRAPGERPPGGVHARADAGVVHPLRARPPGARKVGRPALGLRKRRLGRRRELPFQRNLGLRPLGPRDVAVAVRGDADRPRDPARLRLARHAPDDGRRQAPRRGVLRARAGQVLLHGRVVRRLRARSGRGSDPWVANPSPQGRKIGVFRPGTPSLPTVRSFFPTGKTGPRSQEAQGGPKNALSRANQDGGVAEWLANGGPWM